jgi:hypothetical protein
VTLSSISIESGNESFVIEHEFLIDIIHHRLSLLGRFYAEMVKMDSSTVNSAIFTVANIFILAVNDKPAICRLFADVVCLAVSCLAPLESMRRLTFSQNQFQQPQHRSMQKSLRRK